MQITQTLHVPNRKAWRAWLNKHHKTEREIWLVYHRKATGQGRIAYNDAVEEALCFGWIDSIVKTLDAERVVQRFSPRKSNSPYSQPNKERLRRLIALGKVSKDVLATLDVAALEEFTFPPDILRALKANKKAWANFQTFSEPYQRIRIAFIESVRHRRPAEFKKRLNHFLRMTEQGKQFGYGIEDYF